MPSDTEQRHVFDVGQMAALHVATGRGSIQVAAWDREAVEVTARITDGDPYFIDLTIEADGPRVTAKAKPAFSQQRWKFWRRVPAVHFQVRAPVASSLDASTAGRVCVSSLTGGVRVQSTSGGVKVENLHGPLNITDVSGGIKAFRIIGATRLDTVSGDIKAQRVIGAVRVRTVSGDVKVTESAIRGLNLRTVNGDVTVDHLERGDDPSKIRTVSGPIDLALQPDLDLDMRMQAFSGGISVDLPMQNSERSRDRFRGQLNHGGRLLNPRSVSGGIRLRAAPQKHSVIDDPEKRRDLIAAVAAGELDASAASRDLLAPRATDANGGS